jgi:hypothetical protein
MLFTLMMEAIRCPETSVLTIATRRHISEDDFLNIGVDVYDSFDDDVIDTLEMAVIDYDDSSGDGDYDDGDDDDDADG